MGCIHRHCGPGHARDASATSGRKATSVDMTSIPTSDSQSPPSPPATAVSRPTSSPQTSSGRSPSCESDTLTPRSSAMSAPDSTSRDGDCSPYWDEYTQEISSVSWSPNETVLGGLEPNSSRPCWKATAGNSWFSISGSSAQRKSSPPTSSPYSRYSGPGSAACGDTVRKSRKIRLYPDAARYAYNQTVELLAGDNGPPAVKTKVRALILPSLPPWHRSAPREVLVGAVLDACRAVSAVKKRNAQLAKDKASGHRQDEDFARVRFRSRKNPKQTFTVQANCVSSSGIYRTRIGDMQMAEGPCPVSRKPQHLSSEPSIWSVPPGCAP